MFYQEFLLISNAWTILSIGLLLLFMHVIRVMTKKKVKFSLRMIVGTVLGLVLGLIVQMVAHFPEDPSSVVWMKEVSAWYGLVGDSFMNLLKMLVVPLIFISLVRVIMNMEGNNLGKIAGVTISTLLGTTLLAGILGMFLGSVFQLGNQVLVTESTVAAKEISTIVDTLRGLIPSNIVHAMAQGNVIGVVIFSILIGMAVRRMKKKYAEILNPFVQWVEASYKILISVAMTVIKLMPYGVIALLATTIISRGVSSLVDVVKFIVVLYLGVLLMLVVHLIIAMIHGVSPKQYITQGMEPLLLAFTSRSSLGTLPVLIETMKEKFGINEGVASFVGSIGANMGMNGCAGLYPALIVVMLAQMTGTKTDLSFFLMLAVVILIGSLGIVGLPRAATLAISVAVTAMGMSEYFYLVGAVVAIDPILDMGRTLINVSGTMTTAIVADYRTREKEGEN